MLTPATAMDPAQRHDVDGGMSRLRGKFGIGGLTGGHR